MVKELIVDMRQRCQLRCYHLFLLITINSFLLVRLMMACNDIIMLTNRCMGYFKNSEEAVNQHLKKEACRYFLKIQCSHLVEALELIYELNKMRGENKQLSEVYAACSDGAKKNFNESASRIRGKKQYSDKFQKTVRSIRHKIGFHYDDKMFKKAIKTRASNPVGNEVSLNYSE